jgi:tRNA-dihydrouridine synthase 3
MEETTTHDAQCIKEPHADTTVDPRPSSQDKFELLVQPEFVLEERAASLPPIPTTTSLQGTADTNDRHRKRPREKRAPDQAKICASILQGTECSYGQKCRFAHDVKEFLASRPMDIVEIQDGCPNYNTFGICRYGVACRVGSCHLNMATGANLTKEVLPRVELVLNELDKDVQSQLRKNTYPFKCKRFNQKDEKKNMTNGKGETKPEEPADGDVPAATKDPKDSLETEGAVTTTTAVSPQVEDSAVDPATIPVNLTPLPTKERRRIDFSNKVYIAPLTTVGNLPFRRVMKKLGADITCGEMALAPNLLAGKASEWALLKRHPDEDIFGVQIAAGHADMFTRTCELIENHVTVDFVDLNLGCPIDLVCQKGAGAGLMMRERKLKQSLLGITSTLSCPVTIKMRTGWDMSKPFAHELVPKIQKWELPGVEAIMVHGRSRLQRYQNEANWDYISNVANSQDIALPTIPVIGNGDIFSYEDYTTNTALKGVSSCAMLARGALIKPWLSTEIKEQRHWDISATERLDILKDFVRFGLEHWGSDQQGVNTCRRFMLEWLSFLYRYVPVGILEHPPQRMNQRPPRYMQGRNDLETLLMSDVSSDWIRITEMLLGPVPDDFRFEPKHKANGYHPIEG